LTRLEISLIEADNSSAAAAAVWTLSEVLLVARMTLQVLWSAATILPAMVSARSPILEQAWVRLASTADTVDSNWLAIPSSNSIQSRSERFFTAA
jgi:hypothetical protein